METHLAFEAFDDVARKEMNAVRPDRMVFIGIDLGQRGSHSAIVVMERFEEWPSDFADVLRGKGAKRRYVVRQAERMALGTPYRDVVARLKQVVERVMATKGPCVVVVDEGGPGVPVVERMREAGLGCAILPYTITSGGASTSSTVSRTELLTKLQLMVECEELEIAATCTHREQLVRELTHLRLTGKASGETDDLALALALACWRGRAR